MDRIQLSQMGVNYSGRFSSSYHYRWTWDQDPVRTAWETQWTKKKHHCMLTAWSG